MSDESRDVAAVITVDAVVSVNADGKINYFNDTAERLFGYAWKEAKGKPITLLISKASHEICRDFLHHHRSQESGVVGMTLELTGKRKDGSEFPMDMSVASWKGERAAGITVILRDVSARKNAETEIKHTISLLTATLDSTTDGILVVDRAGKIVSLNRRFIEMWQIPYSVLDSKDDNQALAFVLDQLKDPEAFLAKVRDLYAHPEAESFDILEFKDGKTFERLSRPQRVDGRCLGRVWSFRDVTERKRMEKIREEFIAVLSHELRNPLNIISGYAGLMHHENLGPLNDKQSEKLQVILRNCEWLDRILRNLLDIIRMESGKMEIRCERMNVRSLISDTVKNFELLGTERNLRFVTDLAPDLPDIETDDALLMQVLSNLINNAFRFAQTTIGIKVLANEPWLDDGYVEICVHDDGPGIEAENLRTIFDKFKQFKRAARGETYKGTGLGLAICKEIIWRLGGTIWAESEVGSGAHFHIRLPVKHSEEQGGGGPGETSVVSHKSLYIRHPAKAGVQTGFPLSRE